MAGLLTLKQLSSIFLFKLLVACIIIIVGFDVKMNGCIALSNESLPMLSNTNLQNIFRISKNTKNAKTIKSERATLGTVGSLLSGSGLPGINTVGAPNVVGAPLETNNNIITVNSENLGNAAGYLLAGTFFTATLAQTLYNWDSKPINAFFSGLADRIVPKIFEEVESDTERSDDHNEHFVPFRLEKYCLRCNRKCSGLVGTNDRISKR